MLNTNTLHLALFLPLKCVALSFAFFSLRKYKRTKKNTLECEMRSVERQKTRGFLGY